MNEYKKIKKYKVICVASFFLLVVTLVFQMYISNSTAVKGMEFKKLYEQKKQLEKEIAYLQYEDSNLSSLSSIEKRAKELGFINMSDNLASVTPPSLASVSTQ